jgi:predicted glycosyltransferase
MLISSGDSMAREACALGVTAFYCGGRKMAVNDYLSSTGIFHDVKPEDLAASIHEMKVDSGTRTQIRQKMGEEWDDLTKMVVDLALKEG